MTSLDTCANYNSMKSWSNNISLQFVCVFSLNASFFSNFLTKKYTHIDTHTHTQTRTHTNTHVHAHTHTHTHLTHTHTHTHTHNLPVIFISLVTQLLEKNGHWVVYCGNPDPSSREVFHLYQINGWGTLLA